MCEQTSERGRGRERERERDRSNFTSFPHPKNYNCAKLLLFVCFRMRMRDVVGECSILIASSLEIFGFSGIHLNIMHTHTVYHTTQLTNLCTCVALLWLLFLVLSFHVLSTMCFG